jgi:L-ectoine synthase
MKIKRINQLLGTERDVDGVGFKSIRPVLESDNMGFSVHKTIIPKGGPYNWHYKNHLEACYCIQGSGLIKDLATGTQHLITKDVIYLLDNHDDHTFEALEDVVLISIFNPPVKGREVHNPDGSYTI